MNITEALEVHQEANFPGENPYDYGGYPRDMASYNRLRWRDARPKPDYATDIAPLLPLPVPQPPDTRPQKGSASGNSVPELRADVDAIWQALEDAGIVKP